MCYPLFMNKQYESRANPYGVQHLLVKSTSNLWNVLFDELNIENNLAENLFNLGGIYLNHHRLTSDFLQNDPKAVLNPGDYLRVHQQPRRFPIERLQYPDCIVDITKDYVLVNKPTGLPVHPTVDNIQENICALLSTYLGEKLYVTHRLDMGTGGLFVLARTLEFQRYFNQQLADGRVRKLYRAQVAGNYDGELELTHYMEPSPKAPKNVSRLAVPGWPACRLRILDSEYHSALGVTDLVIELQTGRTHQIRSQLSSEGFPIIGDVMYGAKVENKPKYDHWHLQAYFLSFPYAETFNLDELLAEHQIDKAAKSTDLPMKTYILNSTFWNLTSST
jgi:23S rRNA pseudouridine1911/1915/1917 synthase